ncbi:hypothetical protein BKK40_06075 [Bacillus cereus]|nr:hypothetical protein BKK40_06075 [Bacillus cereus]
MVNKDSLDNNQWQIRCLEEVVDILDGMRKPIKKEDRVNGEIPYYGATGIIDWVKDYIFNEPLILVGEDGENLRSRVLPMAFKIQGKAWVNNHAHVLRPYKNIDIDYLTYYLDSISYEDYITGSAQPKLNQKQLRKVKVLLPHVREQQKIASILSSVDKSIEKTTAIIEQTEEVKKGMMQQLLTKGIGHTRFKKTEIGEIPEEWEVRTFSDVMVLQRGFDLPTHSRKEGQYPLMSANGLTDSHSEYKVEGPGIVTGRSGTIGKVHYIEANFWPLNTTLYVKEMYENNPKFLYYLLSNFRLERFSTGTGVPTLNRNVVHTEKIALPSVDEQQKIALILTNVDMRMIKEKQYLQELLNLKKGLMQSLLTGKVRVKVGEVEVSQV